jgi:hypothetical protein
MATLSALIFTTSTEEETGFGEEPAVAGDPPPVPGRLQPEKKTRIPQIVVSQINFRCELFNEPAQPAEEFSSGPT